MAHILILGQTLSGKSTLAKRLAATYKESGRGVIVHDPVGDPEWVADYKTADPEEFFAIYNESRGCAVFFDEAGETCENFKHEITKTATRGRHRGHRNHYIAQRGTLILRTIRDQCSSLFLFNSGLEDCKIHAAEWNAPEIRDDGPFLETGEYFYKQRMKGLVRGHLFKIQPGE
jgi:energy-coupling factor transporter ATP-binding protein EcfA2